MGNKPIIEIEATFLLFEEGGRRQVPNLEPGRYVPQLRYMPHLVVQSPEIRRAVVGGSLAAEDYLGAAFVAGPTPLVAGRPGRFVVELFYHPIVEYGALEPGATFTIREGGKIVGHGKVVDRPEAGDRGT